MKKKKMEEDLLMSVLPEDVLIDIVSKLSGKVVCKLKCLSKSWLIFLSSNSEFKRLHRLRALQRPPLLVNSKVISDGSRPGFFLEEEAADTHPIEEDFGGRKVVFNFMHRLGYAQQIVASCRDLLYSSNNYEIYVYSPSSNQYLCFNTLMVTQEQSQECRLGVVYVASMNLYKVVKLVVRVRFPSPPTVRFEALSLQEEDEPQFGGCDVDEHQTTLNSSSSWEYISENTMHTLVCETLGNLIGVSGVVYATVRLARYKKRQVLSLGFEQKHSFKMFSLPQYATDKSNFHDLFQVKDLLCFPHTTTNSSIDLWMLKDRNPCPNWFKGYSISYIPKSYDVFQRFAYFPHPSPTISDDDADVGAGIFLFAFKYQLFRYDIGTKEVTYISQDKYNPGLHVFSDNLYPLKNGVTAKMESPERKGKTKMPHYPPPPLLPYPATHKLQLTPSLSTLWRIPPPPHHSLPQCPQTAHQYEMSMRYFNRRTPQPPPPPPPQSTPAHQLQISLPPPPPPPQPFNPHDFSYGIELPEVKKRKVLFSNGWIPLE